MRAILSSSRCPWSSPRSASAASSPRSSPTTEDAASGAADAGRRHFVGLHQVTQEELLSWETRQAYIAMGFLLWAAAERGIDSTCLEGLDMAKMDECLGLAEKGLRTVCAVSLGYRLPDDSNAARPKSRLPMDEVVTVF